VPAATHVVEPSPLHGSLAQGGSPTPTPTAPLPHVTPAGPPAGRSEAAAAPEAKRYSRSFKLGMAECFSICKGLSMETFTLLVVHIV
jgi:hypothetical protein